MKYSQLSNFQKQQYTNYLETQLEKFSTFMLNQKRENEKYRVLEDAIAYQTDLINQMHSRLELLDLYQKQNQQHLEHHSKKISKIDDVEHRLQRLEDRQRFGCDDPNNIKRKNNEKEPRISIESEQYSNHLENIDKNYKECLRKIKKQQDQISNCHQILEKMKRKEYNWAIESSINPENVIEKKDLKKMQKKIVKYLNERLEQIEVNMPRRRSKSSKSPSGKASEMSIIDNYAIKESKNAITSFRIEDETANKSQMSTILGSKSTKNSKVSAKNEQLTKKKRNKSKSKSKSHSKSKDKSKSKNQNDNKSKNKQRSKSKSKKLNKSLSLSEDSIIHTSHSRSNSHISKHKKSKSKDSKLSKRSIKAHSKVKSHSNSHDLCKKRPEPVFNLSIKSYKKKREEFPLPKRKPTHTRAYK